MRQIAVAVALTLACTSALAAQDKKVPAKPRWDQRMSTELVSLNPRDTRSSPI